MRKSKKQGFSLVEVVLALAVVAFAFVAILGLIPAGMNSFRQAVNISVCSQIGQKVIGDCFQADYDTLMTPLGQKVDSTVPFLMNYRYFDEEGNEIFANPPPTSSASNTAPTAETFIYLVITKVAPSMILPGAINPSPQTAAITVQVVFDPGQFLPNSGSSDFTSSPNPQSTLLLNSPKIQAGYVYTYYAHITRN